MDMHWILTSLEAIERMCTYEKGKTESSKKTSHKSEKGKKRPGTDATIHVSKKVYFEKHCNLSKKHGGKYTMHNTRECRRFKKDGKEKPNFCAAKKGGKKSSPVNNSFAQLTEKIEKLKKALKNYRKKGKKRHYKDTTVSKLIDFLPSGGNYLHEVGNYPSFLLYQKLCRATTALLSIVVGLGG
jgi:hypothetical protein